MTYKNYLFWILIISLLGFLVRIFSVLPTNTIIGFDQARDLFQATTIFRDHNLAIIGPTAGNNPSLHHGVLFLYYIIPGLILFSGNPIGAVIENCFFNTLAVIALYFLGKDIFNSKKIGLIAAIITAFSYYYVQFSGWLSNPTGTLFTLPLFFLGLIEYKKGKNWGLPFSLFFLGLTIQFELFFVYLIPTGILSWIILRPKIPSLKLSLLSFLAFTSAISSMLATEIKFKFMGIKSILFAGQFVGGAKSNFLEFLTDFLQKKWETFYLNIWPQNPQIGKALGILAVLFLIYEIFKNKKLRQRNLFLLLWFFSPAIMFFLGIHNAPWFYIGRPASGILIAAYPISKIKPKLLIPLVLIFIISANLSAIKDSYGKGQILLEPDAASLMTNQLKAIDYTYVSSNNEKFEINTLTNPLYINAVWAYHYYWYGQGKYKLLPSWAGGDQLPPYDTLSKPDGKEKYLFLIMDSTNRIPPQYKKELINWANKNSKLVEEKQFGGIEVQKRIIKTKS